MDAGPSSSCVDRRKLKKLKRKQELVQRAVDGAAQHNLTDGSPASVMLTAVGAAGEAVLPLLEAQNLLLWSLHPELGAMPQWVCVRNRPQLHGALLAFVPGLDSGTLAQLLPGELTKPQQLRLPKAHEERLVHAVAAELLQVRLPKPPKKKAKKQKSDEPQSTEEHAAAVDATQAAARPAAAATDSSPPPEQPHPQRDAQGCWQLVYVRAFALSQREQLENGYPVLPLLKGYTACAGSEAVLEEEAETEPGPEAAEEAGLGGSARLLAIDCEMCKAHELSQLARVAVVDEVTPANR